MTGFRELQQQDRRLVLLRALLDESDYSANDYYLQSALQLYGHSISRDQLRTDIAWLAEQDLLTTRTAGTDTVVATLTARGADAATGRAVVPGVKRPAPGA